jgi:hypothetical protein
MTLRLLPYGHRLGLALALAFSGCGGADDTASTDAEATASAKIALERTSPGC